MRTQKILLGIKVEKKNDKVKVYSLFKLRLFIHQWSCLYSLIVVGMFLQPEVESTIKLENTIWILNLKEIDD